MKQKMKMSLKMNKEEFYQEKVNKILSQVKVKKGKLNKTKMVLKKVKRRKKIRKIKKIRRTKRKVKRKIKREMKEKTKSTRAYLGKTLLS